MKKWIVALLLTYALWQIGCVPPSEEKMTDIKLDLKDPQFQKVMDLQDRQQLDSLYIYFRHPNPTFRYLAAAAFGSIRKPEAIDSLAILLKDEVAEVRAAAAYALGQTYNIQAEPLLIQAFESRDTAGVYKKSNRAILEAIGKCGTAESLQFLSTIKSYQPKDTALLEGQVYGIYRFMSRDTPIVSQVGTDRMLYLAGNSVYPESVRYVAVNEVNIDLTLFHSENVNFSITMETLDIKDVLRTSDFLTLHVPFSGGKPLIGKEEFAIMKKGAILVNTSRGGVVDEEAMLEALDSGKLAGVGLDVFDFEPKPRKEILDHPKISMTPHIGAATQEAQGLIGLELADKILAFFGDDK